MTASFFDTCKAPLALLDASGSFTAHNAAWERLSLRDPRLVGKRLADVVHPADKERVERALAALSAAGEATFDARLALHAGPRAMRFQLSSTDEGISVVVSSAALGRSDDAARLSLLDKVLGSAPVILWALDKEGRYTLWDGRGVEALGYRPGELVGQSGLEQWKESDAFPPLLRALSGEQVTAQLTLPGPRHYEAWYLPVSDASGAPDGMIGFGLDVTRMRQAENELRDQLAIIEKQTATLDLLAQVLKSAPLILWALDAQGNVTMSEGKGLELIGLEPGSTVGANAFELYKDNPAVVDSIVRALAGEDSRVATTEIGPVFLDTWFMPLQEKSGEVHGMMGLSIDATDRVKNERELRDKLELIERQSATIRALATPIIQVWDGILCLPVIGTVDSARTADMMQSLLEAIVREQARYAIVDLTGVEVVDTSTADHLIQLFRAAKVLGVDGILCGIRPAVAQTVVALGLELGNVRTMRSLRDALAFCMQSRAAATRAASAGPLFGRRSP